MDNRDFINNMHENQRNFQLVSSIHALATEQHNSNGILKQQCDALIKRNTMLEEELKQSQKETKKSMVFNIITTAIAFVSLIFTILINILFHI